MATSNLKEFNAGLDQFYKKDVEGFAATAVRRVAFAVDRAVVMGTPVGNPSLWKRKAPKGYVGGRARANWIPTLEVPYRGTVDRIDKQGTATIALLAPVTADFRLGQTIWISNNLSYIVPLNEGHSTQAPAGYVEMAVQEGLRAAFR